MLLTATVLAAFVGGMQRGIAALLIIRPLCDRLFEQARFDVAGRDLSYGAVLNFIVIAAMLLSLLRLNDKSRISLERAWIPFLLVAAGVGWVSGALGFVRRHAGVVAQVGGALLIVIGVLLVTGVWDHWMIELRDVFNRHPGVGANL